MSTHYNILGVSPDASESEIRKAYRQLSLQYHPDRNDSIDAVEKFKQINEANEILSDPDKRKQYDFELEHGQGSFEQQEHMQDINNIMSQMFGSGMGFPFPGMAFNIRGGGMGGGGQNVRIFHNGFPVNVGGGGGGGDPFVHLFQHIHKPPPIEKTVSITLVQSYNGGETIINFDRTTILNGIRSLEHVQLTIQIPQGIHEGEQHILENQGNATNETIRGDLHIKFELQTHTHFRREGNDLHYKATISLKDAICGFNMTIQHINGKMLTMNNESNPTIIKPNYKKTVAGLGMIHKGVIGNLIIDFSIEFPNEYPSDIISKLKLLL